MRRFSPVFSALRQLSAKASAPHGGAQPRADGVRRYHQRLRQQQQHWAPWRSTAVGLATASASSAPAMHAWMDAISPRFAQLLSLHKKKLATKLAEFEVYTATMVCSLTDTRSGQRLLACVLPPLCLVWLFPSRFYARAYEMPLRQRRAQSAQLVEGKQQWLARFALPAPVAGFLEELLVLLRGLYLAALFSPAVLLAPLVFALDLGGERGRRAWMDLLLWTIERAGPAFIKWAQWSSSRPDLFPQDLCTRFEALQTRAPAHDGRLSLGLVQDAFQRIACQPVFEDFDPEPVASGSIAQVHRARLSPYGAALVGGKAGQVVAVKVRHPGVSQIMQRDFVLMQRAAQLCGLLPGLAELRLDESIRQFGGPLKEQLDLVVEAQHLERFRHNFRRWHNVSFPRPLYPLVASDVLVETFEQGDLISAYVHLPDEPRTSKQRSVLAEMGLNLYLQMLLQDNFCHADLHPGNILVRESCSPRRLPPVLSSLLRLEAQPRLVLLDAGMIAELRPLDQRNLVDFFRALTRQDGANLARSVLELSERHTCKDPEAFVAAMTDMFDRLDPQTIRKNTSAVFKDMIETLRQHQVTLKSTVSTIVVTTLVLEGWSSKLDPDLHILDSMRELLGNSWAERVGRTVDRVMVSGSLALA